MRIPQNLRLAYKNNDPFLGTLFVTGAFFITNVLAYLLQLFMARNLSVVDFGTFTTMLSLVSILAFPVSAFGTAIIKIVSELKAENNFKALTRIYWQLSYLMVLITGLIVGIFYLLRAVLSHYLNIADSELFIYVAVFLGVSFLATIPISYLQGLQRFKAFSVFTILSGVLRFILSALLVTLGYAVVGGLVGLSLALILAYFIALLPLKKNFVSTQVDDADPVLSTYYKGILFFGLPTLLVTVGTTLLNNVDVLLVKHFFDVSTAGIYAGVLTLGKILLFGAGTVTLVMFPRVTEAYTQRKPVSSEFKKFLVLQLIVVACGVGAFILLPGLFSEILFGSKFSESVAYVPLYAVFVGIHVMISFLSMFLLAIGKTRIYLLQLPVIFLQCVLIVWYHSSLYSVITVNVVSSIVLLVLLVGYVMRSRILTD